MCICYEVLTVRFGPLLVVRGSSYLLYNLRLTEFTLESSDYCLIRTETATTQRTTYLLTYNPYLRYLVVSPSDVTTLLLASSKHCR